MKKALVCGAGGFIGHHLVKKLKAEGYWVRGVDLHYPMFSQSMADDFQVLDLRVPENCRKALMLDAPMMGKMDEVYQLAADMGGMGFIHNAESEIMRNSALINIHMIDQATQMNIGRFFFSSSACVYRDMQESEETITEEEAYPAMPDNEYGWEKLYSERMILAFGRKFNMPIRIARFQNCYGPEGTWRGGREKAPAALSRKVAAAREDGIIDVWGDGTAMRSYTYVDDMVDGIFMLMQSNLEGAVNIGSDEFVSVNHLVQTISKVAGKKITTNHIEGPVGVQARNHSFAKMESIGWKAKFSLEQGMRMTYAWVENQVRMALKQNVDIEAKVDYTEQAMT
jgi:GDP-D-mannose 3', 5'-epimerase